MSQKEKSFNIKLYAVAAFVAVAVFLAVVCTVTFKAKYTAFHPDKLAEVFVENIAQSGDGYNAYKNTLVSKNMKYGDFIRKYYIEPNAVGEDGTVLSDEALKAKKTLEDDGTLAGQLIERMYPVYKELIDTNGWDNYDLIFSEYIKELKLAREEIFGDRFFNDEVFFSAFEANVSSYSDFLTGTEDVFDENTGLQLSEKTVGKYEEVYGEDYSFTAKITSEKPVDMNEYIKESSEKLPGEYGVSPEDISEVKKYAVDVFLYEGFSVAAVEVTVVKIGYSWYVDNVSTDTKVLYSFYH